MKITLVLLVILLLNCKTLSAQSKGLDSLAAAYKTQKQDSTLVKFLTGRAFYYRGINSDSGMICLRQALALSRRIGYKYGETSALNITCLYYFDKGDLAGSMKIAYQLLPKAKAINDVGSIWGCYSTLGLDYHILQDYKKSFTLLRKSLKIAQEHRLSNSLIYANNNLIACYIRIGRVDSAEYFYRQLIKLKYVSNTTLLAMSGRIALLKGNYTAAVRLSRECLNSLDDKNLNTFPIDTILARAYEKLSKPDSTLFFAKLSFEQAERAKRPSYMIVAAAILSECYEQRRDYKNAFYYAKVKQQAENNLYNQRKALGIQAVASEEDQRQQQLKANEEASRYRMRLYTLIAALGVLIVIISILYYYNRQRKKANVLLEIQKQDVHNTLNQLKATQTQLIQSEKMASLGELTAGIAHEIQNPLNFVNNFSEVSVELLEELKEEAEAGNKADVLAIADDLVLNLQKINHHGKRADFIVKGMLQHSRTSSGERQLTNINVLADEFLKLSYHGLRAKDKNFNAELLTNFDEGLTKVNVVQQDIGRVLLNLFNNAFYTVNEKKKTAGDDYKPAVSVTTSCGNGQVIISVKDNGIGIPDAIKDKIMQPFFTTKPTGEGTGLGLSLSYDIVVKGHGGSIDIKSKEGEGSAFIVKMPISEII